MQSERKIGFDYATLDSKIILDDDNYLVMPAVIASEIVQQYEDGWAYKPADELEQMYQTAQEISTRPVKILEHPGADTNYLLVRRSDVYGRAENFEFVKNLKDPKTGRPMRRGIKADIRWFKNRVPSDILEQIRSSKLHDVSIGFTYDADKTPGEFNGVHYDYVQRNLYLDHIAAPIPVGRCPGPICGIGFDQKTVVKTELVGSDKVEKRGNRWCVVHCHGEEAGEVIKCFDTEAEALAMHQAIEARKHGDQGARPPEDWFQNCKAKIMEKSGYTEEQANATCADIWYNKPEQHGIGDCPICSALREVGLPKAATRLAIAYGQDVLGVIRDEKKPQSEKAQSKTNLDIEFQKAFGPLMEKEGTSKQKPLP